MSQRRNAIPTLPKRLAELRNQRGWTQKQLAARAGTSHISICRLEQGQRYPSLELAGRIADALGVPIDDLRLPVGAPFHLLQRQSG